MPLPWAIRARRDPLMSSGRRRSSDRHREDDRLDLAQLAVVDVGALELLAEPRDHADDRLERAHAPHHAVALQEVLERELPGAEAALHLLLLVRLGGLLGLLDQREHVAHAEDARGHAVGVEVLELVELLAGGGELDRLAGDRLDGEGGPAARVAVELRQDDAVEVDPLGERLGDGDGLLAGHRVEDEEDVVRLHGLAHRGELLHQRLVDLEAAGGVDDDDVAALRLRLLEPVPRDRHRVLRRAVEVDGDLDLLAELLELVDRRGPLEVGGDERRRACPPACGGAARAWRRRSSCPAPWRPARRITVGGRPEKASLEPPEPISSVSSSWTIRTTSWPGERLLVTAAPAARSRTRATNSLTTLKLTSASSSASRISRIARERSSSVRTPRLRRSPSAPCSLSESVSNMAGGKCSRVPFRT